MSKRLEEFIIDTFSNIAEGAISAIALPTTLMDARAVIKKDEDRICICWFDDSGDYIKFRDLIYPGTLCLFGGFSTLVASTGFPLGEKYNFYPLATTQLASLVLETCRFIYNRNRIPFD